MKQWQDGGAVIDGAYRYLLWRTWDEARPRLLWVMLNPGAADGATDDPTVRRCNTFSRDWSYGSIEIVNLFAYRTSHRQELRNVVDPIGSDNDRYIAEAAAHANKIVVAWGEHGAAYQQRVDAVLELLKEHAQSSALQLQCLGRCKNGSPCHPLYLAQNSPLIPYEYQPRGASANVMTVELRQAFDRAAQQPEAIQASLAILIMKALDALAAEANAEDDEGLTEEMQGDGFLS